MYMMHINIVHDTRVLHAAHVYHSFVTRLRPTAQRKLLHCLCLLERSLSGVVLSSLFQFCDVFTPQGISQELFVSQMRRQVHSYFQGQQRERGREGERGGGGRERERERAREKRGL
jgi:hypothetical protein